MAYSFFDKFRGVGSKTNNIHSRVYFDQQAPTHDFGDMAASTTLVGGGFAALASQLSFSAGNLTVLAREMAKIEFNSGLVGLYYSATILGAIPILYSIGESLYSICNGVFETIKDPNSRYFVACGSIELGNKFLAIIIDPIISLLFAFAQTIYAVCNLILTIPALLVMDLDAAHTHFKKSGSAYMDIFAHLTSAVTSFILDFADFGISGFKSLNSVVEQNSCCRP